MKQRLRSPKHAVGLNRGADITWDYKAYRRITLRLQKNRWDYSEITKYHRRDYSGITKNCRRDYVKITLGLQ